MLVCEDGELKIDGYTNSESDVDDRKSIFRFIFTHNGGAVSWKSFKQIKTVE